MGSVLFLLVIPLIVRGLDINTYNPIYTPRKAVARWITDQDCRKIEILRSCLDYFQQGVESIFIVWDSNGKLLHDVSVNNVFNSFSLHVY